MIESAVLNPGDKTPTRSMGRFTHCDQEAGCWNQKGCSSFMEQISSLLFSFSGLCWRSLSERRHVRGPHWQIRVLLQGWLHRENMPGWHRCLQHCFLKWLPLLQRSHLRWWWGIQLHVSVSRPPLETLEKNCDSLINTDLIDIFPALLPANPVASASFSHSIIKVPTLSLGHLNVWPAQPTSENDLERHPRSHLWSFKPCVLL